MRQMADIICCAGLESGDWLPAKRPGFGRVPAFVFFFKRHGRQPGLF